MTVEPASPAPRERTWRVSWPLGQTAGLAALVLLAALGLLELVARQPWASVLPSSDAIASLNFQFERKRTLLDTWVAQNGRLDCLIVGNSMIDYGVDPEVLAEAFAARAGTSLRCFNMGLDNLRILIVQDLLMALVRQYHPRLLVYGTSPIEYRQRYQGQPFPYFGEQWLGEFSYAYRRYRTLLNDLDPAYAQNLADIRRAPLDGGYTIAGYRTISDLPLIDVSQPPSPVTERDSFNEARDFAFDSQTLSSLDAIVKLGSSQMAVAVIVLPVHPTFLDYLGDHQDVWATNLAHLRATVAAQAVPLFEPPASLNIPSAGWHDRDHLAPSGAALYSAWLGGQLADAVQARRLAP